MTQFSKNGFSIFRSLVNRTTGWWLVLWENVLQTAFETLHDDLKPAQCDALCALLQSKERRWRKTHFLREGFEGHVAPLLLEEGGELLVQWGLHPPDVNENPFRIRNI